MRRPKMMSDKLQFVGSVRERFVSSMSDKLKFAEHFSQGANDGGSSAGALDDKLKFVEHFSQEVV
jgi:hypothetical protein